MGWYDCAETGEVGIRKPERTQRAGAFHYANPSGNLAFWAIDDVAVTAPGDDIRSLFVRGDADSSGTINLTDGLQILNWLFLGGPPP